MLLYLFNSMTRKKEEFKPIKSGEVRMYTCGPTVYNYAHIGNFRAYVFEDLLRRTLEYYGYKVIQVMNLTDVDDKTIRDSRKAGVPLSEYTKKFKDAFFEDIDTLKIERAEYYPEATAHINEMIELISVLMEKGYAYQAKDGSVYFSIQKFPDYGKLAKIDMENQKFGVRIKTDEYEKESLADFALWKAWDESDGDVYWDSPWGKGRPGWHIECSAMSMKYLGKTFDIHTGGIDNMFPHHEDEIAQSEAATGCKFVNYWLHNDYLLVNGEKMSKSLGNFYTLRDILNKGYTGEEVRWALISTHYRKKLNFTFRLCEQARKNLNKLNKFISSLMEIEGNDTQISDNVKSIIEEADDSFAKALGDDLNISAAIAAVFNLEREINKKLTASTLNKADAQAVINQFKKFNKILAVFKFKKSETTIPKEIQQIVAERNEFRKKKDFANADKLRDKLKQMGWIIKDTPQGTKVYRE